MKIIAILALLVLVVGSDARSASWESWEGESSEEIGENSKRSYSDEMPPNAKDETQEMFRYLDKDHDESLSFGEMKAILVEAGFKNPRSIFKGFDLNEDGVVALEEYRAFERGPDRRFWGSFKNKVVNMVKNAWQHAKNYFG